MDLLGKVAVVTGASSGLGRAIAVALAREGTRVVAVARRTPQLAALAAEHPGIGWRPADVTSDADVAALAGWVAAEHGACHLLVNSAGAMGGAFEDPDVAGVRRIMDLNFMGTVRCMSAFADLLFASAPARVVNVASVGGRLAATLPGYAASKFAVVGFTEAVAPSWGRKGVSVSLLSPGLVVTEGFAQRRVRGSRAGRLLLGTPEQVAAAAVSIARRGTPERVVPRRYRPLILARHVCPPLYRALLRRL